MPRAHSGKRALRAAAQKIPELSLTRTRHVDGGARCDGGDHAKVARVRIHTHDFESIDGTANAPSLAPNVERARELLAKGTESFCHVQAHGSTRFIANS